MTQTSNTKVFARVEHGVVRELFCTGGPIEQMFHPSLVWVDATDVSGVAHGWSYDGIAFAPPEPAVAPAATASVEAR